MNLILFLSYKHKATKDQYHIRTMQLLEEWLRSLRLVKMLTIDLCYPNSLCFNAMEKERDTESYLLNLVRVFFYLRLGPHLRTLLMWLHWLAWVTWSASLIGNTYCHNPSWKNKPSTERWQLKTYTGTSIHGFYLYCPDRIYCNWV